MFLLAIALNMDRYSLSESGCVHSPICMPSWRRMSAGTVASTSASMDSNPTYWAIAASSALDALLCLRSKESSGRSASAVMPRAALAANPGVSTDGERATIAACVRFATVARAAVCEEERRRSRCRREREATVSAGATPRLRDALKKK